MGLCAPEWWYEQDDGHYEQDEKLCSACMENEQKFDQASELVADLVKRLYIPGLVDPGHIESLVDELCYLFHVKKNDGEIQIQKLRPFS